MSKMETSMIKLSPNGQRPAQNSARGVRRWGQGTAVSLLPLILLGGCAAFPAMDTAYSGPNLSARAGQAADELQSGGDQDGVPRRVVTSDRIPVPVTPPSQERTPATAEEVQRILSEDMVDANLAPQSIPQFVSSVFGGVLNLPFTMGPDVATRTEIIAGGSGGPVTKQALFAVAQQALRQYGIEIYIDGNSVTVGASRQGGAAPVISRAREPNNNAGRVVHFYTAQTIEVSALQTLLQDLYPNLRGARISTDPLHNTLIISGPGRDVSQVVRAVRDIDKPRFAGAEVVRIEPIYWSTEALSAALEQVLATEGYMISRQALASRSLVMLAFPSANQILVFGRDPVLMDRVRYWVNSLDQPASLGDKASTFVYPVMNTDAQSLGQMAMGQTPTGSDRVQNSSAGSPGAPPIMDGGSSNRSSSTSMGTSSGQFMGGRILVDNVGNRIIFNGTASDFSQLRTLLSTLDTPAPQVVIEVMIAEVTLTDNTSLGVQLFGTEERGDGRLTGDTEGIEIGKSGLLLTFNGADFRARLNASAGNSRVNILQRPQLVARSGGTARFQVGTDVPVITSQRASDTQSGNNRTDILQTVQYRQTGVILELTPVVYGDRVDITISQEISEVGKLDNPAIASPPILNRSLKTQIALADGWTGVLGGLISNNYGKSNSGVPFLKDVPFVGSAFQNNSVSGARTELLMLITPKVIRGDEDMADLAEQYASDMNAAFRTGRGWSYTLTPFNVGFGIRGVGLDLPRPNRLSEVKGRGAPQSRTQDDTAVLDAEDETETQPAIQAPDGDEN